MILRTEARFGRGINSIAGRNNSTFCGINEQSEERANLSFPRRANLPFSPECISDPRTDRAKSIVNSAVLKYEGGKEIMTPQVTFFGRAKL